MKGIVEESIVLQEDKVGEEEDEGEEEGGKECGGEGGPHGHREEPYPGIAL